MYDPIRDVLEKPEEERLSYALELLAYYTVMDTTSLKFYSDELSLTLSETRILLILARRKGMVMTYDSIIESTNGSVSGSSLKVSISRLNKKLPDGCQIKNYWGAGYFFVDDADVLPKPGPNSLPQPNILTLNQTWSNEDEILLKILFNRGMTVAEIAIALRRSARSVTDKIRKEGMKNEKLV